MGDHQKAHNCEREESSVSTSAGTESRALSGVHQRTGNRIRAGEAGGGGGRSSGQRAAAVRDSLQGGCRAGAEVGQLWVLWGTAGKWFLGSSTRESRAGLERNTLRSQEQPILSCGKMGCFCTRFKMVSNFGINRKAQSTQAGRRSTEGIQNNTGIAGAHRSSNGRSECSWS